MHYVQCTLYIFAATMYNKYVTEEEFCVEIKGMSIKQTVYNVLLIRF